jgi:hypothetical protein
MDRKIPKKSKSINKNEVIENLEGYDEEEAANVEIDQREEKFTSKNESKSNTKKVKFNKNERELVEKPIIMQENVKSYNLKGKARVPMQQMQQMQTFKKFNDQPYFEVS